MIASINDAVPMPSGVHDFAPHEWSDADEAHLFEIPEWESLGFSRLSPRTMSRHFLLLGGTGSGKTKSGIMPILASALRYRSGEPRHRAAVLVIDPKFELASFIDGALSEQDRVRVTLDVQAAGRRIELFEGLRNRYRGAREAVLYTLNNCSPAYVAQGTSEEQFWRVSGFQIIESLVACDIDARAKGGLSIWSLMLSSQSERARRLREFGVSAHDVNYYANAFAFCIAAMSDARIIGEFAELCKEHGLSPFHANLLRGLASSPDNQRGSQLSMAYQYLAELADAELSRLVDLRPPGTGRRPKSKAVSIRDIVENGDVLHFSPNAGVRAHDIVGRLVKTKFLESTFSRRNKERAVFYVCDEFQRFITSDALSGEQSFLDRCRAYRVVCALATQSVASLEYGMIENAVAPSNAAPALGILLNNSGNKLFFRNADEETQACLERLFPTSPDPTDPSLLRTHPVASLSVGECYYLLADGRMGYGRIALDGTPMERTRHIPAVRLMKRLDFEVALDLCDQVERLIRFQRATDVNIEIDSGGGSLPALRYILAKFREWQNEGVRIHTTVLNIAGSAAAILAAMGTPGHRRAYRYGHLLFHRGRYDPSHLPAITGEFAIQIAANLSTCDDEVEEMLGAHLVPQNGDTAVDFDDSTLAALYLGISGVHKIDASFFRDCYRKLTARDRYITAAQAKLLSFVDDVIE